jgi:crotonobetainyl-CoA:carnitine CoA-transferase CaiB-like acyl-CoA transferase
MKALDHLTILDLSRVAAGPFGAQNLADLGARVWKVESLQGDDTRRWRDPRTRAEVEGHYFCSHNRGKQGLAVNFKDPRGQQIVKGLARHADVLIENYKVGDLARYGLAYEDISRINPRIIYASITGYGQTGPRARQLGYDTVVQALTGMMTLTGDADRPPTKVGVAWIDVMTGLSAVIGILAAVAARDKCGRGQHIDISLFDVGMSALIDAAQDYLHHGHVQTRSGNVNRNFAPSDSFEASDGWLIIAVASEQQFQGLCAMLDRPDLASDERFHPNARRLANRAALTQELAGEFIKRTRAEWVERAVAHRVPVNPIFDVAEALADPQAKARNTVWNLSHPVTGALAVVASPFQHMSMTPASPTTPPPALGEHTRSVLQEILGCSAADISALQADGVIHCH